MSLEPEKYSKLSPYQRRSLRAAYIEDQKGLCYWCKEPLHLDPPDHIKNKQLNLKLFPPNFLKYPVHLQHDHDTDLTEGAVHAKCNGVMWQYHGR